MNALKHGMEMSKFETREHTMKLIEALEGLEMKLSDDFPQGDKTLRKASNFSSRGYDRQPRYRAYSAGKIAIETKLSLAPLTCTTNGCAESTYFMVLRMPTQSVAPLKALGFRKWPSCTASTQAPADRLIV
jgi:hypothetical protein